MATLAGATIASTYATLIKLDANNATLVAGASGNAIQLKTGDNDTTPLYLNTDRVGIGTASPGGRCEIKVDNDTLNSSTAALKIHNADSSSGQGSCIHTVSNNSTSDFAVKCENQSGGSQFYVRGDGFVGIGTVSPGSELEVVKAAASPEIRISCHSNAEGHSGYLAFQKSDNTEASPHIVVDNEVLGIIQFRGWDGDDAYIEGAQIIARTNGTPADGVMPTDLEFWTNTGGTASARRMTIDESGFVGIGTTSPNFPLDVAGGSIGLQDGSSVVWHNDSGAVYGQIFTDSSDNIYFRNTTSETLRMTIAGGGAVTIANLAGSGSRAVNASSAGLLSAASDKSLKEEVLDAIIPGLAEILQLKPVAYKWLKDIENRGSDAAIEIGFFANDVAPIIPSAAPKCADGLYGFYDRSVTAALVKAIQELSAKVTALENA